MARSALVRVALAAALLAGCGPTVELPTDAVPAEPQAETSLFALGAPVAWPGALGAHEVEVRGDPAEGHRSPFEVAPEAWWMRLADDLEVRVAPTRVEVGQGGAITWVGRADGEGWSEVLLTSDGDRVTGSMRVEDRLFQLWPRDGGHVLVELDETALPPEHPVVSLAFGTAAPPEAPLASHDSEARQETDVLVLYTPAARLAAGSTEAIRSLANLAIAETNQGYVNSGIEHRVRLVHAAELPYDETDLSWEQTLTRLRQPSDGYLDDAHALRDEHGADHVVLLVGASQPYAGIGYQLTRATEPFFDGFAFTVVSTMYATGAYTFAHELGHNMGADHDPDNAASGYFPDSRGHRDGVAGFRTIMAYPCTGCTRVNHWSSPSVRLGGNPLGIAGKRDNARTLRHTAMVSAGLREPPAVALAPIAELTSPAAGAVLPETVTFTWNDVGATRHYLLAGRAVGAGDIHAASAGTSTSATVHGIVADGRPVHVRLWTQRQDGSWGHHDRAYKASQAAQVAPPRIVAPAPGTQLEGSYVMVTWEPGDADDFWLEVGTPSAPGSLFGGTTGSATSWLVGPLPEDGRPLRVKVWGRAGGKWLSARADYTAYQAPDYVAEIISPVPGSTLAGTGVRLAWTATTAAGHWLRVGTAAKPGAYFDGAVSGQSVELEGLPCDGSLVRALLWSNGADGWALREASYVACE